MKGIVISAGHHLKDPGAVNTALGITEAQEAIGFKKLLVKALECLEIDVVTDDDNETNSQFQSRIRKDYPTYFLLEIHFNSVESKKATGTEVVISQYASPLSIGKGRQIVDTCSKVLGIRNRGILLDNQTPRGRIGVVNLPNPAVLLEICFLSNEDDMKAYNKHKSELAFQLSKLFE